MKTAAQPTGKQKSPHPWPSLKAEMPKHFFLGLLARRHPILSPEVWLGHAGRLLAQGTTISSSPLLFLLLQPSSQNLHKCPSSENPSCVTFINPSSFSSYLAEAPARVSIPAVINHVDTICLWSDVMKMTVNLCDLLPQNHNPSLLARKTSDRSKLRDVLQNTQPALLETVKVIKTKRSLRNCHGQGSLRRCDD